MQPSPGMDVDWAKELPELGTLIRVAVTGVVVYLSVILAVRINGLRSFSKMSSYDFAMTVGVGTLMASTMISDSISLGQGLAGLATLFVAQRVISVLRRRFDRFHRAIDNSPLLLMDGERILKANLAKARVTEDDLRAKLREANVHNFSQVRAVVFEGTGDISVLHHASQGDPDFEPWLLDDVRR